MIKVAPADGKRNNVDILQSLNSSSPLLTGERTDFVINCDHHLCSLHLRSVIIIVILCTQTSVSGIVYTDLRYFVLLW